MEVIDISAIILAVIGMVSGWATYWFDRRKHKVEVKNLEAQIKDLETNIRQKELNLGTESGWVSYWLDHRKHKAEVKNLEAQVAAIEADTRKKYMDLAKMYVDEYTKNIAAPLEKRVNELTNEVKELKDELEKVKHCACYRMECDKRNGLHDK